MPIWVEELQETTYPQEMENSPDLLSIGLRCRSDSKSKWVLYWHGAKAPVVFFNDATVIVLMVTNEDPWSTDVHEKPGGR
eukprot:8255567-Karenia_brevis.AAC.1